MDQKKNGLFIAEMRKKQNLTQQELADKLGISTNAVSKWERGLSFPDVSLFKDLCKILNISIEELINGEKDTSQEAKEKAIITTIKNKNKEEKKVMLVSILSFIIGFCLLSIIIYILHNNSEEGWLEEFYQRNIDRTIDARTIESLLVYRNDGKYPNYYGGLYISDDAYEIIIEIVKDKIPENNTKEYMYYNEVINCVDNIRIEYVKYSYNELNETMDKLNDYFDNNVPPKDMNGFGIDIKKNKVIVHFVKVNDEIIEYFKDKIIDSKTIDFESDINSFDSSTICTNYYDNLGTPINKNEKKELLISIKKENKKYIPVVLSLYTDNTYSLSTTYKECLPGKICSLMLEYTRHLEGEYNVDIDKILENSINSESYVYNNDYLPEYTIFLGNKYIEKYDTLEFIVPYGKKNKYIDELLDQLDIDLSKCAKPEYIN